MKHSKSTKAIALLMSMTMITSVFVGNTLSRYVTSVSSTDSARVAVWGINAGEDTVMNLFSEDYIVAGKTIAASNTDGEKIMAPGTAGEAEFSIINFEQDIAPEVAYEVKISLDDSAIDEKILNNPSVQWKLDNGAYGTWEQLKTSILSLSGNAVGRHVYGPGEFATAFQGTQTHTIYWQWLMDNDETIVVDETNMSSNEYDTYMGNLALTNDLNAVIKVSITAQQVDDLITNEYILDGADQTVNLNDIEPITIRSSADFSTFDRVEVEGQSLTRDVDYIATEGSTVITLKEEYLSKLAVGTYIIDIVSTDVIATTKFNVIKEDSPEIGIVSGTGYIYLNDVSDEAHNMNVSLSSDIITDFSDVTVTRYGKNLFDISKWQSSASEVSAEIFSNNTITFTNSTQYQAGNKTVDWIFTLSKGTYTLSLGNCPGTLSYYYMEDDGSWSDVGIHQQARPEKPFITFTLNKERQVKFAITSPKGTITFEKIQLEFGNTATAFEDYIEPIIYNFNSEGFVNDIPSISPNVTFITNKDDIAIKCKYKKKLNTLINVYGKKMAVIGDSISEGVTSVLLGNGSVTPASTNSNGLVNINQAWWQQVQTRYGIGETINNSKSGASFCNDGSVKDDEGNIINRRLTTYLNDQDLPDDLDVILVFGGTNDYSLNHNLGSISDEPSTANWASFYAAVKASLEYLTTNFPNAEIIYFTPLPRWAQTGQVLTDDEGNRYIEGGQTFGAANNKGYYLEDYRNAIIELCDMYDVLVCDLYTNSGFDMGNFEWKMQYAPDGLHPNLDGTNMYVNNAIFPFLDEIWQQK